MLIHLKLTSALHDRMLYDLERPHPFAYERVGFIFVRKGIVDAGTLLLLAAVYHGVRDQDYIDDQNVGAKINSTAIRLAMEQAMAGGYGLMHVHLHNKAYSSSFSRTDRREFMRLIPSFHNIGGGAAHGAIVFSGNRFSGQLLSSKHELPVEVARVTVVGYPIKELVRERSKPWKTTVTAGKAF